MMAYFVVTLERGGSRWDWTLPMRRQWSWDAHAAFIDQLAKDGFIVFGGPLGDENSAKQTLLIIDAPDARTVAERLRDDPWHDSMVRAVRLEPLTVLIGEPKSASGLCTLREKRPV